MKLSVVKPFTYAQRGVDLVDVAVGDADLPEDAAKVALAEGWAVKDRGAAPRNKMAGGAVANKTSG